jgi:peptidoglycan LD-endopeptidase LytH
MLRLAVLAGLLLSAAWFAREAGWIEFPLELALPAASPHERYARTLDRSGLADTSVGRAWKTAAESALTSPVPLTLPATRTLPLVPESPDAWAFSVSLRRGQRVEVITTSTTTAPVQAFVDLFTISDQAREPAEDAARAADVEPDTSVLDHERGAVRGLTFEAREDRNVIVRVQPELLGGGTLRVAVRAAPALRFPVANVMAHAIQSPFGAPRDGGRRQHEGVDIFASRGTPVVSASDGIVMRVGESRLGGRVIWVWDTSRGVRLYYAHLHEQLVSTGTRVQAGDVIGTVGNTGNARGTPPHLHFGIYDTGRGAIDPFWFIAPAE